MMNLTLQLSFRIALVWAAGFLIAVAVQALLPDRAGINLDRQAKRPLHSLQPHGLLDLRPRRAHCHRSSSSAAPCSPTSAGTPSAKRIPPLPSFPSATAHVGAPFMTQSHRVMSGKPRTRTLGSLQSGSRGTLRAFVRVRVWPLIPCAQHHNTPLYFSPCSKTPWKNGVGSLALREMGDARNPRLAAQINDLTERRSRSSAMN